MTKKSSFSLAPPQISGYDPPFHWRSDSRNQAMELEKMNAAFRKIMSIDADRILGDLTIRQHVNPHAEIADSLATAAEELGYCPLAVERAMQWLELSPTQKIGRLRRVELMQLARCIHRFWRSAVNAEERAMTSSES